jgi:hypothetical protein
MNIAKAIYNTAIAIDRKLGTGNEYSYETAPYCGHYYSGFRGKLVSEHFNEGMGGGQTRSFLGWRVEHFTEEEPEYKIIWTFGHRVYGWYRLLRSCKPCLTKSAWFVQFQSWNRTYMFIWNRKPAEGKSRFISYTSPR